MIEISAFEAKTHFSDLLRRVACGEQFLVTMRGKPVARLLPTQNTSDISTLLEELHEFRTQIAQRGGVLNQDESSKDLAREGLK